MGQGENLKEMKKIDWIEWKLKYRIAKFLEYKTRAERENCGIKFIHEKNRSLKSMSKFSLQKQKKKSKISLEQAEQRKTKDNSRNQGH